MERASEDCLGPGKTGLGNVNMSHSKVEPIALLGHQRIPTQRNRGCLSAITPHPGKQSGTPTFGGYPEWNKERSGENEFAP